MKFAELHNVLIVHGSGNDGMDIDVNTYFPNDFNYCKKEVEINNFINVGSISKRTDSTMVSRFSNYGKENVDLFAPGEEIYVAYANNKYGYDSGTSIACPMISGTAALVWLNYPNLSVQEVKKCILDSGVFINKKVLKPGTKRMVPFSDLCKTGRILNVNNALLMAKQISNKK
jgi:subtilisin family serine protease